MKKIIKIIDILICIVLLCNSHVYALSAQEDAITEGEEMGFCDYINASKDGSTAIKDRNGIFFGSMGSGMYYFPKGMDYARENWVNYHYDFTDFGIFITFGNVKYGEYYRDIYSYDEGLILYSQDIDEYGVIFDVELNAQKIERETKQKGRQDGEYSYDFPKEKLKIVDKGNIWACYYSNSIVYYIKLDPFQIIAYDTKAKEKKIKYQVDRGLPPDERTTNEYEDSFYDYYALKRETFGFDGRYIYFYAADGNRDINIHAYDIKLNKSRVEHKNVRIEEYIKLGIERAPLIKKYGKESIERLEKLVDYGNWYILGDDIYYDANSEDYGRIYKFNLLSQTKTFFRTSHGVLSITGNYVNSIDNSLFFANDDSPSLIIPNSQDLETFYHLDRGIIIGDRSGENRNHETIGWAS